MSGLGAARDPATPEKVWIVERSDGQYEEYREKIIAVYLDEGMANEHAKKADEWHTKWVTEPRHNILIGTSPMLSIRADTSSPSQRGTLTIGVRIAQTTGATTSIQRMFRIGSLWPPFRSSGR
jgi:hypothetical protein